MAQQEQEKLPWEMTEEILSRVSPKSLDRFRAVSKPWNALIKDKKFINKHKASFRFILLTKTKIYSVSIDPEVEVRELTLDVPGLESQIPKRLIDCNGFLLCEMEKGAVLWNPWLKETGWIESYVKQPTMEFNGIGYEFENCKNGYKALGSFLRNRERIWIVLRDIASSEWEHREVHTCVEKDKRGTLVTTNGVSLNGVLYWIASYIKTDSFVFLVYFDFSEEIFVMFCDLPCWKKHHRDALVLRVFTGDRFSLLKQCHVTKKIEIWVTTKPILKRHAGNVKWMNIMEVSSPNLPDLVQTGSDSQPSYFIDNKKLLVCSCDEIGQAWIYVAENNKLISKIKLDSVTDSWPSHCTYIPSLVPVPRGKKEEAELQVVEGARH